MVYAWLARVFMVCAFVIICWMTFIRRNVTCCGSKSPQAAFAYRAALVYDWLAYDDKKSIMYVEPAMLMMMRALPKYIDVIAGVLDALVTVTKR
jgi:Integrator complex subunit 3 N-terminal